MGTFYFKAKDGKEIFVREWSDVENPKGIIQISHGMVEHSGRYEIFANEMNKRGYIVFSDDHRAHGKTDDDTPGYSEGNIFGGTLSDLGELTDFFKAKYNLPVVIVGHSYGSFLTQRYIEEYGDKVKGAVIGGSNYMKNATVRGGRILASLACDLGNAKKPAHDLKKLSFDAYDKQCGGSFISSMPSEVERYFADEKCTFVCSYSFYKWFFKGIYAAYDKENLAKLKRNFPVLLIAGEDDPVGEKGKGVKKLAEMYKNLSLDVTTVLYPGVRHEFLNDTSRAAAIEEIANFADRVISK